MMYNIKYKTKHQIIKIKIQLKYIAISITVKEQILYSWIHQLEE